ncbi:MAG: exodeoxyribonuclease V subunit alpha [Pseudomonadota bacterium]
MKNKCREALESYGLLNDIDIHFARLMCRLSGDPADDDLFLAAALASNVTNDEKHVCLDLTTLAGRPLLPLFTDMPADLRQEWAGERLPDVDVWTKRLLSLPVVGSPGEYKPLILDLKNRLYLYRYWSYEQQLAADIKKRLALPAAASGDFGLVHEGFKKHAAGAEGLHCWQKLAVAAALTHNVCIISGGPGTGKTFTVAAILQFLLEQNQHMNIKLCAPTGRAAARLQECLQKSLAGYDDRLHRSISTIHRLLGTSTGSPYFYHNKKNPLRADAVIVDEASMVPLALMAKLVAAVPAHSRIILLGDKDQLASVEAGSVLGDICEASAINCFSPAFCERYRELTGEEIEKKYQIANPNPLTDCAVELQHSFRFEASQGIGALSSAVNEGDAARCAALITHSASDTLKYKKLPLRQELERSLASAVQAWYEPMLAAKTVEEAYAYFTAFKILCSHRQGMYGAAAINTLVEKIFQDKGLIDIRQQFYKGRPVMITRNDYGLRLFNGDTGIIRENEHGDAVACFPGSGGAFRCLAPARLPGHETAYAMTIHKAQGSEFDHVLIILPDTDSPLLTREIIYTGITRAKKQVVLWATQEVLASAVRRRIERTSGLRDALLL